MLKAEVGLEAAEQALAVTASALAALKLGNVPEDDEVRILMEKREKKQASEVEKLKNKAPTQKLRKETLASIRRNYVKQLQQQADARQNEPEK